MAKTIVCSVGTSVAKKIGPPSQLIGWVREHGGPEHAAADILDTFRSVRPEGGASASTFPRRSFRWCASGWTRTTASVAGVGNR